MYDFDCPHCEYEHNIEDCLHEDYLNKPGEFEYKCKCCEKQIIIVAEPVISYSAKSKDGGEMILQIKPVELPEDICWWFHPDIQFIDPLHNCDKERGYTTEEWETMQANGNIDIEIDTSCDGWDIEEAIGDADGHWTGWKPTPPTPDHFLIAAFDTDHTECVLWWAKQRNPEDQQHE